MQDLHATLHHFPLEGGSNCSTETHKHLPDMRAPQELLSVLHA
jgi:hypothetical protein